MEMHEEANSSVLLMKPDEQPQGTDRLKEDWPIVDRLDLSGLSSYHHWQTNLANCIRTKAAVLGVPPVAVDHLIGLVKGSGTLYRIHGDADIYIHKWPNGETKTIPMWGSRYILQADWCWIRYYPFLVPAKGSINPNNLSIIKSHFKFIEKKGGIAKYLVASHNNHFGHFLLDNMPGMMLMGSLCSARCFAKVSTPVVYRKGIKEFIYMISGEIADEVDDASISGSYCIKSVRATEVMGSNIYTNAFLWRRIGGRIRQRLMAALTEYEKGEIDPQERVFLVRSGSYTSRIANYDEIANYLKNRGFCILDASLMNTGQLTRILSSSKVIVSESGSTTLNAVTLGNSTAKVISLNPKRLLKSPSIDMINGGLPYLFAYCEGLEIVMGETVRAESIQSSDLCYYELESIARHIDKRVCYP